MVEDYDNILVPVDGSETAERAFDKAVKIALDNNAHLDVLNVIDTRQFMGEMQDTLISGDTIYQMTQDSEEYLKSLKEWAKDHHNDLIIMGATGMNAVERMLMGSVTAYVNQHALSDVLIVKTDLDNNKVAKPKKKYF